jgi:methionyl-tRNA formyltransferase
MSSNASDIPRVLFFGRHGCRYSQQTPEYLHRLGFEVAAIFSESRKEKLPEHLGSWHGDYILCFRSFFILPLHLINQARVAAINFHPAPAEYPGSGCLNWALYDGAAQYGVTAHLMNQKVDNGPIIECRRFSILPQDNVSTLLERTHQRCFDLMVDITAGLATGGKAYLQNKLAESAHEKWRGHGRKMREIDQLQIINPAISKAELDRVVRATYTPEFPPEIRLHGYRFVLKLDR